MAQNTHYAKTVDLSAAGTQILDFNESDIVNVTYLNQDQALVQLSSGTLYLLKNVDALSSGGASFTFNDGAAFTAQALSLNAMIGSSTAAVSDGPTEVFVTEATPANDDGAVRTIVVDRLIPLSLGVEFTDIQSVHTGDDNSVVLTLNSGQTIVLEGVAEVLAQSPDAAVFLNNQVLTLQDFVTALNVDTGLFEIQVASLADELALVEPAAGEGAGGVQNSGFTFGSADSVSLTNGPAAVGAINATSLVYTATQTEDRSFNVTFGDNGEPIFNPPTPQDPGVTVNVNGSDACVQEDGTVFVPVEAWLNDADGSEVLSVTVSGIPSGWGFSGTGWTANADGTYTYNGLAAGEDYSGGFVLVPPADSDIDLSNLVVSATATETNGDTANATEQIDVVVDAVADAPDVSASDVSVDANAADQTASLSLSAALTDTDGSEAITALTISGVPAGFSLSAGTDLGGGVWSLSQADLTGLTLTPSAGYEGSVDLTLSATSTETPTDAECPGGAANNTATSTETFTVTWGEGADVPTVVVNTDGSDACVLEDGSVFIPVTASLNDADGSEVLSVTVSGIPSGWAFSGTGWTANADGTYTYSALAAGEDYSGGFVLVPPADSDIDLSNLVVSATATETNGDTASATEQIDVVVDAVADAPDVSASFSSNGSDYTLNLAAALNDVDGSESLSIIVSGVPDGFSLSAGTDLGGGQWSFTPAELGAVTMTAPVGYSGTVSLTVAATATETPSDAECPGGAANNTATTTANVSVNVDTTEASVFEVGPNTNNALIGASNNDILVGDTGGSITVQPVQDYNLNIIVDTSGSLQDQWSTVQAAINSLLGEVSTYDAGTVHVNIIPFAQVEYVESSATATATAGSASASATAGSSGSSSSSSSSATATAGSASASASATSYDYYNGETDYESANVTTTAGLDDLVDFVNGLNAYGPTNFEAVLADAADIITDNSLSGATATYTLFISDGAANAYTAADGTVEFTPYPTDSAAGGNTSIDVEDQINGTADGSNEIAALWATSDEVFSVIVGTPSQSEQEIMDAIDSDGTSTYLNDADDLDDFADLFNAAAEEATLSDVGDDTISGSGGADILFGDVLFTDDLADQQGLDTDDGAGFQVFQLLEATAGWDRDDTIAYIQNNAVALSEESNLNGEVREGGNDVIYGGAGDDLIFGQEGDDLIDGGEGADYLSGGSGADTFVLSGSDVDTISDFSVAEGDVIDLSSYLSGYNAAQDAITDFVRITTNAGNSIVSVSEQGNGAFTTVATLSNVVGLTDEQALYNSGAIAV